MIDQLTDTVAQVRALRARAGALPVEDLGPALRAAQSVVRAAEALVLDLTAAADQAKVATAEGAASTAAWLAESAGVSRGAASRDVKLATDLQEKAPQTREALDLPGMSADKARVIARAMRELPRSLDGAERAAVEADLIDKATRHSWEDLRRAARRALDVVDRSRADQAENDQLVEEETRAHRQATFWMKETDTDGLVEGGFLIPAIEADILRTQLQAATAPRKDRTAAPAAGGPSYAERQGRAFVDLIRRLPVDPGDHGGVPATLVVTMDEAVLRNKLDRAGTTSHGTRVSAGELRRLACGAGIIPAVLGGSSRVLDLGRRSRLFNEAQRIALGQRDGGCAFPGCDRPPGWTEAHHLRPWASGGSTDLADGVLLCGTHHRLIHQSEWSVRRAADGQPEFIPPAHLDPHRRPRRNDRWRAP